MLYKLVAGESPFDLNHELSSIPEFKALTPFRMSLVILTADRKSPLRTLADKQKREKAYQICGGGMEGSRIDKNGREFVSGKVKKIEAAIAKYREFQADDKQNSLDVVTDLIKSNREFINEVYNRSAEEKKSAQYGKDLKLANEFAKGLPELEQSRQKLEEVLDVKIDQKPELQTYTHLDLQPEEGENSEIDENLSTIDKYWQQQK